MIDSIAFQTQARTIDHLGREQIADCPTAISELWKNSYDAYAKVVELTIFEGAEPVATVFDDGHGMSRDEFVKRWLVVGTESKFSPNAPQEDRNGLPFRPRQGQKGIGRLSSANLGPLLLLVSKRTECRFVASLVDWRIFENPFLYLSDIRLPVFEFDQKEELFNELDYLFESLMENVWGGGEDNERSERIKNAWSTYDIASAESNSSTQMVDKPSEEIADTIISACFEETNLERWPVWSGGSTHGTAMLISGLNYDLRANLGSGEKGTTAEDARKRFFETLSSFIDPLYDQTTPELNSRNPDFQYSVKVCENSTLRTIVGDEKRFGRHLTDQMEHIISGTIDADGVFRGKVKAFGDWREEGDEQIIRPPNDLKIPKRSNSEVGPVDLYITTFEQLRKNTTHSDEQFQQFNDLANRHSGFMIFRDGLRVLPYGRVDNDFFEIEMRRSIKAGREFWNARRMFGRLALTRLNNPNLKDKAGREGFIDNVAVKTLKILVENILKQSARKFFGGDSDLRKQTLPEIQDLNKREKARVERKKLATKNRKDFRKNLKKNSEILFNLEAKIESYVSELDISNVEEIVNSQGFLDNARESLSDIRLKGVPKKLGTLDEAHGNYQESYSASAQILSELSEKIEQAISRIDPPDPTEIVTKQLERNARQINRRLRNWKSQIGSIQSREVDRLENLVSARQKVFHADASKLVESVKAGGLSLRIASSKMEALREEIDTENADIFETYRDTLEALNGSIDLVLIAATGAEENEEIRSELARLYGLAQLGIAVEILGHELQSYDEMIGEGIRRLPANIRGSIAVSEILTGYEGLTRQLNFLSPLKLSGQKVQKWITGAEIFEYLSKYFFVKIKDLNISLTASKEFNLFRVYEQPSRILPVFINLVNNSQYWLSTQEQMGKEIALTATSDSVIVSDNGPGIEDSDIEKLFSLFFTRKMRGGRGVGLYLCRANLASGGHSISYFQKKEKAPLSGANFEINFKGAEYAK